MVGGKHACILAHKGSGKTVTALLFALWYCFFHWDKRVAVVCRSKTLAWQLATWFWCMANAIDPKYREQLPDLEEITDYRIRLSGSSSRIIRGSSSLVLTAASSEAIR